MCRGFIRMLCSAWNTSIKLKVPEIPKGIPSENDPWPMGYVRKTAVAAATGAEKATKIHGLIPRRYDNSHSRPMYAATPKRKCMTINWY